MSDEPNNQHESARDRYVEALIEHRYQVSEQDMDRRVARVMHSLSPASPWRWQWWALPLAAVVTLAFVFTPSSGTASSLVKSAIRASAKPGDRRYLVTMTPVPLRPGEQPPPLVAMIDVRDGSQMRCELRGQDGGKKILGRSDTESWEIHPNGDAVILNREGKWPRWVRTPSGDLLFDSMSGVLEGLIGNYTLERLTDPTQCPAGSALVVATRIEAGAPTRPAKMELCVDESTGEVTRLELTFDPPPGLGQLPAGEGRGDRPPPPPHRVGPPDGPPSSIVFEAQPTEPFPAGWFDPPIDARQLKPRE